MCSIYEICCISYILSLPQWVQLCFLNQDPHPMQDAWFPFKCVQIIPISVVELSLKLVQRPWLYMLLGVFPFPTRHMRWVVVPMVSTITAAHKVNWHKCLLKRDRIVSGNTFMESIASVSSQFKLWRGLEKR